MVSAYPRRGEIWLIDFDPTVGSEIRKTRPGLIVSPDAMNEHLRTVLVMPLTSGSRAAPFRLELVFRDRDGRLLGDQIRTLDRKRLRKRLDALDPDVVAAALAILRDMFTV